MASPADIMKLRLVVSMPCILLAMRARHNYEIHQNPHRYFAGYAAKLRLPFDVI
ncbi:hypothetical protein [Duganella radicis]|uniref:hypothetical protein n=1 Tax=Duganella radicis TaxID=551988 RepID=UPI0014791134|nr:hypothetical protein [Duganella radicis]